jgi:hypothetical protein
LGRANFVGLARNIKLIYGFIGKLDIFPLMCAADKVWITELTLINNSIRSVRNSHAQELTLILKIIGQCDVKHILMSPIKSIRSVLKILSYIITSIPVGPVGLAAIMSVLTFKTAVILYDSGILYMKLLDVI